MFIQNWFTLRSERSLLVCKHTHAETLFITQLSSLSLTIPTNSLVLKPHLTPQPSEAMKCSPPPSPTPTAPIRYLTRAEASERLCSCARACVRNYAAWGQTATGAGEWCALITMARGTAKCLHPPASMLPVTSGGHVCLWGECKGRRGAKPHRPGTTGPQTQ